MAKRKPRPRTPSGGFAPSPSLGETLRLLKAGLTIGLVSELTDQSRRHVERLAKLHGLTTPKGMAHGTRGMYTKGKCRCEMCCAANTAYHRRLAREDR